MITKTTATVPSGYTASSAIYKFEPEGLTFAKPVTVTLAFWGSGANVALFWSKSGDAASFDNVGGTVSGATIVGQTMHFSQAFVGAATDAALTCQSTQKLCGAACVDPQTDGKNCGACGSDCGTGTCEAGACKAAPPTISLTTFNGTTAADATWVAWQDEDGGWTHLAAAATGVYHFTPTHTRYGVTVVCAQATATLGTVFYQTTASTSLSVDCAAPQTIFPNTHTLGGTWLTALSEAVVNAAFFDRSIQPNNPVATATTNQFTFALQAPPVVSDLVLTSRTNAISTAPSAVAHMQIMRDLDMTVDHSALAFDFTMGADVFVPTSHAFSITNHEEVTVNETLEFLPLKAIHGVELVDLFPQPTQSGAQYQSAGTYAVVPGANLRATDRYWLSASATSVATSAGQQLDAYFHTAADVSVALPLPLSNYAVTTAPSTTYLRPHASFDAVSGAASYSVEVYRDSKAALAADTVRWTTTATVAWLPSSAALTIDMADYSAVEGWNNDWGLPPNAVVKWSITATLARATLGDGYVDASTTGFQKPTK